MELLDNEPIEPEEACFDPKIIQCVVNNCNEIMLESEFMDHVVDEHAGRLIGLIKESVIIDKLSIPYEG